jgi:uncharacterized protein YukE
MVVVVGLGNHTSTMKTSDAVTHVESRCERFTREIESLRRVWSGESGDI